MLIFRAWATCGVVPSSGASRQCKILVERKAGIFKNNARARGNWPQLLRCPCQRSFCLSLCLFVFFGKASKKKQNKNKIIILLQIGASTFHFGSNRPYS